MTSLKSRAPLRPLGRASALALVVAAGLAGPALAQQTPPAPAVSPAPALAQDPAVQDRVRVTRIEVRGANQRIEDATVLSYLPIRPGDVVDPVVLDVAVQALSRTGLFADVQMGVQNGVLIVEVVENPIVNQVIFEGNGAVGDDKLREEVTIRPRGIYTAARVQEDVGKIVELYRLSGRISATVSPKIVRLEQNRVDVVFEIDEGPETGLQSITFLGNEAYSDSDLREVMVTKQSVWWRIFTQNDNYDPNRLDYDREQLRDFYTNRGYYDFRVVSAVAELTPGGDAFAITLTVDEGDKYNFGEVKVSTENERLNAEFLTRLLPFKTGDLYESDRIETATDTLTYAAGSAGYAFVEIEPAFKVNPETDTIDVTFNVREGERVYVERINVIGNTRTIDPVIRRELMLTEGDAFNRQLVERSRNNLRGLGFFKDVTVEEVRGSQPDRSVVNVTVEEQPTGELSVGAGFSSYDSFVLNLGISESNFRGRGQNVVARAEWGSLRQNIDFRFTEPKFLGRDLRAGFDLFHSRYDLSEYSSYDYRSTGAGLRISYPLNGYTAISGRYFLREDEIIVPFGFCGAGGGSSALCDQVGSFVNSSIGYTLLVDRRNDPIRPTRGWSGTLRQDLAGIGGDVNYLKTEGEISAFHGFSPEWIVTTRVEAGYVTGWAGDPIRINDRFFKGGNSFRGFETAGIGPRDLLTTDALGGNFYVVGTVELTIPNGLPEEYGIRTSAFVDVGTLGLLDERYTVDSATGLPSTRINDEIDFRGSFGVSIHWRSPMGPIRFDLAQPVSEMPFDKTESFRFSTSTQF
ncbi:MAG: outer membrane protein assembly factor BamA [Alphaproteobacteria bacterium]|nr:outer membrane protein assembly factor BamA [Alphaproteobacteria bacterium]MBU1526950.1 outer membrane protein assembly factor BamA [Alphaproteobacteria bacterium]MBU2118487.1 outer membrane protein assembly factor BamA [Alphaproteobacteria bacterium]MBU2350967.1 outer membrane protein assembly factor BamA [Alphaproteobacteria bacterium]MBU2383843.1 outer membrane protein assembly factor BamA [Alphaproteobacteria bacterium]